MWRCLIVEDDRESARYLARGLHELGHAAVVCHDGVDALNRAIGAEWDVIILDRMLPNGIDGLAILSTLRSLGRKTPVLVLSALTAIDERVTGLDAGGDDYLTKPYAFSELVARLKALVRRVNEDAEQRELQVDDLKLDLRSGRVERAGRQISLQPREFRLLACLMFNVDSVVTRTMLLENVWDYRFDPQSNVIDVQISRLRRKVDHADATSLIHTVRGAGYMLSARPDIHEAALA